MVGAQLFPNGANEADCRSWKEANLPQDGDKLTHSHQTFAHLLPYILHFVDILHFRTKNSSLGFLFHVTYIFRSVYLYILDLPLCTLFYVPIAFYCISDGDKFPILLIFFILL